ncbi:MAG: hypothetical protein ACYSUQ_02230 [Planctomycetota bacterium]|jgi:hypothetical protein
MPTQQGSAAKTCRLCGQDCSDKPRVKDKRGQYYCRDCYEKARSSRQAASAAKPTAPPPSPPSAGEATGKAAGSGGDSAASLDLLAQLAAHGRSAPVVEKQGPRCPGCSKPLAQGVVVCTNCGYDLRTGQRLPLAQAAPTAKPARPASGGFDILRQPWVFGAIPTAVFIPLFLAARTNDVAALAYLGLHAVFALVVVILVLIKAFGDSITSGILCLICGPYALYFVFTKNDDTRLKYAYGAALVAGVLGYFL